MTRFTEEEKEIVKAQTALYQEIRPLVLFGDFYRLLSPFEGNAAAWMFVAKDKREAFVVYVQILQEPNAPLDRFRLRGLDPDLDYELDRDGLAYGGDELMNAGLPVPQFNGDFLSRVYRLRAK